MKCRFCGCTQFDGCPGGCGWARPLVCTICQSFIDQLADFLEASRRVTKASLARMFEEATEPLLDPRPAPRQRRRRG